jgi:glycine dehydrogenase subunit 1
VFNEVLVQLERPVKDVLEEASKAGILAGYSVGGEYPELSDCLLIAVTEKRTKAEIDKLVDIVAGKKSRTPKAVAAAR